MNYTGEYTGPYWSNGEIQQSVEWGEKDPTSQLDWLSRQHDSAYAHFKDRAHREAADLLYMREAKKLAGRFPELAGNLVGYGNYAGRQVGKLVSDIGISTKLTGNPILGAVKFTYDNISDSVKRINGTYLKNEIKDIQAFHATDPYKKERPNPSKSTGVKGKLIELKGSLINTGVKGKPIEPKGSLIKVKVKPSTNKVVSHDGAQLGSTASQPLGKSGGNEMNGDVMVGHKTWFQRLKKKKKKHAFESIEDRVQRLALNQQRLIHKHEEKRQNALNSRRKIKNKAFGLNRVDAVRERVLREK
jgi:hypothetical protein